MLSQLKAAFRSHADHYPGLFQVQQNISLEVRTFLKVVYETDFNALRLIGIRPKPLFLDVGGNYGQSIGAMRALFKDCTIHSFEPNPVAFAYLSRRWKNTPTVILHQQGLGSEPGELALYVPQGGGISFSGKASLLPLEKAGLLADLRQQGFTFLHEGNLVIESRPIPVRTLDSFDFKPDFIKIDVEGHEAAVLRGATAMLSACHPPLLIERGERAEIMALLTSLGYRRHVHVAGKLLRSDTEPCLNSLFLWSPADG